MTTYACERRIRVLSIIIYLGTVIVNNRYIYNKPCQCRTLNTERMIHTEINSPAAGH